MEKAKCESCRFFAQEKNPMFDNECRKRPPTLMAWHPNSQGIWPKVNPDDFCGDWDNKYKVVQ